MYQDFFVSTLYRQPSLIESAIYPEPHRAELLSRKHTISSLGGLGRERRGSSEGGIAASTETYNPLVPMPEGGDSPSATSLRNRRGSISLNVHELVDDDDETFEQLEAYFNERVVPLSVVPQGHIPGRVQNLPSLS